MTQKFTHAGDLIDQLEGYFLNTRSDPTAMESLSNAAHMLQTAAAATAAGAHAPLVAAALLHDIGHWLDPDTTLAHLPKADTRHEDVGAAHLAPFFDAAVCQPVQLHVAAKRYLCAAEPSYFAQLSPASVHSLNLQGGAMTPEEMSAFEAIPEHKDAVALRRWDEYGKNPDLEVPEFSHYRQLLLSLAN